MAIREFKIDKYSNYTERTKRNHFWVGGIEGQFKLKDFKIGIAGLGGMGSNIAEIFARLGVGHLRLTDPDIIERSNINRQVIANEDTLGKKKAWASEFELKRIAPDILLEVSSEGIQEHNVEAFVEGMDVIINEIDVFHIDKQILLIEAAHRKGLCVYTALVVGLGIHLYKYDPKSKCTAQDFLGHIMKDSSAENLVHRLGSPLPDYLKDSMLTDFIQTVKNEGVPIFGASTYLGQSMLAIRVLCDHKLLSPSQKIPMTPALPQFLVLDPLMLELKKAEIKPNGEFIICEE